MAVIIVKGVGRVEVSYTAADSIRRMMSDGKTPAEQVIEVEGWTGRLGEIKSVQMQRDRPEKAVAGKEYSEADLQALDKELGDLLAIREGRGEKLIGGKISAVIEFDWLEKNKAARTSPNGERMIISPDGYGILSEKFSQYIRWQGRKEYGKAKGREYLERVVPHYADKPVVTPEGIAEYERMTGKKYEQISGKIMVSMEAAEVKKVKELSLKLEKTSSKVADEIIDEAHKEHFNNDKK